MEVQEQKFNAFNWGNLGFPCCYALNLPIIIFPAGIDVQNCAICCIAVIMNGKGPWNKKLEQSVRILEIVTDLFLRSEVMPPFQIDKRLKKNLKGPVLKFTHASVSAWKRLEAEFMVAAMRKN